MTLDDYRKMRMPESYWRVGARIAILEAITEHEAACKGDHAALVRMVDAAYPFGEREMYPYKCWLKERGLFIRALRPDPALPTDDEIGVCEVARDLVELGRLDEARVLLEEQAPHRLARKCIACGAPADHDCVELSDGASFVALDHPATHLRSVTPLIVPHHARLVGHLGNGPLFGGRDA